MMNARWPMMFGFSLVIALGCAGPTFENAPARSSDPVLDMLHQGIIELNGSIEELKRHIADLQQIPPSSDPTIQELYALDLAAWQLHLQQWLLQRDHLVFAVNEIQRVQTGPQDKSVAAAEWNENQKRFVRTFEELSTHRQQLERKRFDMESQVVGRYFR